MWVVLIVNMYNWQHSLLQKCKPVCLLCVFCSSDVCVSVRCVGKSTAESTEVTAWGCLSWKLKINLNVWSNWVLVGRWSDDPATLAHLWTLAVLVFMCPQVWLDKRHLIGTSVELKERLQRLPSCPIINSLVSDSRSRLCCSGEL